MFKFDRNVPRGFVVLQILTSVEPSQLGCESEVGV